MSQSTNTHYNLIFSMNCMHGNDKKLLDLLLLAEPLHGKIITGRSDLLLFQSSDRKNIITATFKAN